MLIVYTVILYFWISRQFSLLLLVKSPLFDCVLSRRADTPVCAFFLAEKVEYDYERLQYGSRHALNVFSI